MKKQVLILCTGNSARSQMAEGFFHAFADDWCDTFSAGTHPSHVHPLAIAAMAEKHIDISGQRSKSLTEYLAKPFDFVITVCDKAAETCPMFPGSAVRIHWSFPDPAQAGGSDEEKIQAFRNVRNDMEAIITHWLAQQTNP